jgi:hypothetical protein
MEEVTPLAPLTFNGPLEAGLRAVALLGAAFPRAYDLQRLTGFDYLLVRTHQLGGPDDLHPTAFIQTPATEVRRKVVLDSLHLMMTRDLVSRHVAGSGILYRAGEAAAMFLGALQSPYLLRVKDRAGWLVENFGDYSDADFSLVMRKLFDQWVVEFQDVEKSLGDDS